MKINNKLKAISIAICYLVVSLWSETQGMDDEQENLAYNSKKRERERDNDTDEHINPKTKKSKNSLEVVEYNNDLPYNVIVMIISFAIEPSHINAPNLFKYVSETSKNWRNAMGKYWEINPLNLKNKDISPERAVNISMGNFFALTKLDLSKNFVGDKGAIALSEGNFINLKTLLLVGNKIGFDGVEGISTGKLSSLTCLDLSDNYLVKINQHYIGTQPLSSGNLVNLATLFLDSCCVGNEGVKSFRTGNLTSLTKLDLGRNVIMGDKWLKELHIITVFIKLPPSCGVRGWGREAHPNRFAALWHFYA